MMDKDAKGLNKLVKKAGSVLGERPDSLESVVERCTTNKMHAGHNGQCEPPSPRHPGRPKKHGYKDQFCLVPCNNNRFKNTFVPSAIRLFMFIPF